MSVFSGFYRYAEDTWHMDRGRMSPLENLEKCLSGVALDAIGAWQLDPAVELKVPVATVVLVMLEKLRASVHVIWILKLFICSVFELFYLFSVWSCCRLKAVRIVSYHQTRTTFLWMQYLQYISHTVFQYYLVWFITWFRAPSFWCTKNR